MPWSARVEGSPPVVCSTYRGSMMLGELRAMIEETLRLAVEAGVQLYLGDCTELEPSSTVVDIYEMVMIIDRVLVDRGAREAMIAPRDPEAAAQVRFFETACRNRGLAVRVFDDRDEALRWLFGGAA